jgi:hypothetical protein
MAFDPYRWIGFIGPVVEDQRYEVDVTPGVQGGPRLHTLVIENADEDGARFGSRDSVDPNRQPRLRLELALGPECDDGHVCTVDARDPIAGCTHAPVPGCCTADADCADGLLCNGVETCDESAGECRTGTPPTCDDGVLCTRNACDPALGCVNVPVAGCCRTAADCDDLDACTGVEACDATTGACAPGVPPACDDGDACNGAETCDRVSGCRAGASLVCDDGDGCTADRCDSTTGCAHDLLPGLAGAECVIAAIEVAPPCVPPAVDVAVARDLARRLGRARTYVTKSQRAPSPRPARRLRDRAEQQLRALVLRAGRLARAGRITEACRADLERVLELPRQILRAR